MLEITNIIVDPFDPKDYVIYWEFSNQKNRPLNEFIFRIFKAQEKHGNYKLISRDLDPSAISSFRDKKTSKLDRWSEHHYKIEVEDTVSGKKETYGPGGVGMEPSPSDKMIIRNDRNKLLNFARDVLVFSQPREGRRCGCFNTILNKTEVPDCKSCGGTGYLTGHDSIYFTKMFFPSEMNQATTLDGPEHPSVKGLWTSNYPIIREGDMIVTKENNRYSVTSVSQVEPHGVTIKQQISVIRIKRSDVMMKIEVPEEFKVIKK